MAGLQGLRFVVDSACIAATVVSSQEGLPVRHSKPGEVPLLCPCGILLCFTFGSKYAVEAEESLEHNSLF